MRQSRQAEGHQELPVRQRLIRLRRRLGAGQTAIERPINGQDAEGAVEVVLGAGGLVEQVHLDPDWPALQGTDLLCAAVLEAYRSAEASQLAEWADAVSDDSAPGKHQIAAPNCPAQAAPSSAIPAGELQRALRRATAELPEVLQHPPHRQAPATRDHVLVHLDDGDAQITGISLDASPEATGDTRLARALTDALRAASATARTAPDYPLQRYPGLTAVLGGQTSVEATGLEATGLEAAPPEAAAPGAPGPQPPLLEEARQLLQLTREHCRLLLRRAREHRLPEWTDLGAIARTTTGFLDQLEQITATAFRRAEHRLTDLADPARIGTLTAATLALTLHLRSAEAIMATVVGIPQGLGRAVGALEEYVDLLEAGADRARLAG